MKSKINEASGSLSKSDIAKLSKLAAIEGQTLVGFLNRILSALVNQSLPACQEEGTGTLKAHVVTDLDDSGRVRIYKPGSKRPLDLTRKEVNGLLMAWTLFDDYVTESYVTKSS